eukprot:COSAG04_NODE_31893_length_254_cov_0.670968_1_plen_29_part_01
MSDPTVKLSTAVMPLLSRFALPLATGFAA